MALQCHQFFVVPVFFAVEVLLASKSSTILPPVSLIVYTLFQRGNGNQNCYISFFSWVCLSCSLSRSVHSMSDLNASFGDTLGNTEHRPYQRRIPFSMTLYVPIIE